jgi:amino acid transporter
MPPAKGGGGRVVAVVVAVAGPGRDPDKRHPRIPCQTAFADTVPRMAIHTAPSPSDAMPALDEGQLQVLAEVGQQWAEVCGNPEQWRRALPVDPGLTRFPSEPERPRMTRLVSVAALPGETVEATPEAEEEAGPLAERLAYRVRRSLIGRPLRSTAIVEERMRKLIALPVLSADALSSVAYGPEAMVAVLVLGGAAGLRWSLPIGALIALLMLAVGVSYRQTIRAYPHGGGSYIVATENLGRIPGLLAAGGLLTDYILTVAVSIAAGVAAVTSAIPSLRSHIVLIGLIVIVLLLAGNLRGVRQAGVIFAAPTYAFIAALLALVVVGLADVAGRNFTTTPPPPLHMAEAVGVLLLARAFASGSTAMTGIEAISNAVPAFQPPEWRNARATLTWMIATLIVLFAGVMLVAHFDGVVPSARETVLSQLARRSFGSGAMYAFTQASTAAILLLAANTAYNDLPRVLFLLARDNYAPRLFLRLGDRLAFSNGIALLTAAAALVYAAFGGKTEPLIPLFAVGVFLAFTLSQTGMVVHWLRVRDSGWRRAMAFNAVGAVLSAIVFVVAGLTKFTAGAWVALLFAGGAVVLARAIRRHYDAVAREIALRPDTAPRPTRPIAPLPAEPPAPPEPSELTEALGEHEESPSEVRHLFIVPVENLDLVGIRALAYAASLRQPVLAVHVSPTEEEAERFRTYWRQWGDHLPLEVVVSPYRAIVAPLISYVESLHDQRPDLTLTVMVPELVMPRVWQHLLHSQIGVRLRRGLRLLPNVVVTTVPYHFRAQVA